ncbi:MAG: Fic family protein [Prevotella sp.]
MIWKDRVDTKNWNIPFGYGQITLENLRPHAKNPTIANFFAQLGIVEELGNGTRTMFKYVPLISGGVNPVIKEEDEFTVSIPYLGEEIGNKPTVNHPQTTHKPPTNHPQRIVLSLLEEGDKSIAELMEACGYKDKRSFRNSVLNALISNKMIAMTHPENPNHRNQRYVKV